MYEGDQSFLRTVPISPQRSALPTGESIPSLDWLIAGGFSLFGFLHGSLIVFAFVVPCYSHTTLQEVEGPSSMSKLVSVTAILQIYFLLSLLRAVIISGDVGIVFHPHPLEVISITRHTSRCDGVFLAIPPIAEHYTIVSLVIRHGSRAERMVFLQRWDLSMKQRPPRKPPWIQHITEDGDATKTRIKRLNQQPAGDFSTNTITHISFFRRVLKSLVLRCNGWIANLAFRKRKRWYIDKKQMFPKLESHSRLTDTTRATKHIFRIAAPKLLCFFVTEIFVCIYLPMCNITIFGSY